MKHRFTITECQTWSDRRVLRMLVTERLSTLDHHTPLAERLRALQGKLERGEYLTDKDKEAKVPPDSPEKAVRDRAITTLEYHEGVFRQFFTTPYSENSEHVGKPFKVLRQVRPSKWGTKNDEDEDDMYEIQFEDGTKIQVYGHEVCVLDYEKCLPVFPATM